jgi:hypothetical protein
MSFRRISVHEAKKRFFAGDKHVYFCPHKFRPDGPFSMAVQIFGREWLEQAEGYDPIRRPGATIGPIWKGTIGDTAWALAMNNWAYYNASYETGYYPWYYVWVDEPGSPRYALCPALKFHGTTGPT